MQVGLHDHREQRLVDAAPALEQRGEERPGPQLRDPELEVARGRGQRPRPAAVAQCGAIGGAFPRAGTDHRSELGVDQRLVDRLGSGTDAVLDTSGLHGFEHLK